MNNLKFIFTTKSIFEIIVSNNFRRCKGFVTITEVGPRDGLQYEKYVFPLDVKVELINRLSATGLNRIESGSFVNPKLVPQFIDTKQVFENIKRKANVKYSALVPNIKGLKSAIEAKVDEIAIFGAASEKFSEKNINCTIETSFNRFKDVISLAKDHQLPVRGYLSCVIACPYAGKTDPKFVGQLAKRLIDMGCFEISLGDTIGVGTPDTISTMLEACLDLCPVNQLALHCHDTNGMAIDNLTRGIEMGIKVVDSSIAGLGGCPFAGPSASGNVATEKVIELLHKRGVLSDDIDRQRVTEVGKWISEVLRLSKKKE